ncbi:MAG: dihydroxyacetone kinase subunit DhaL [Bryobacteraceae bacterium]
MKKLINRPDRVVDEMLDGLLALYPGLSRLSGQNVLLRSDFEERRDEQVAIISGGGSGHEPAHAGFIGSGMLSAAVAGEIFTSPSVDSVLAAIRSVAGKHGVLLIVKNYTGDRINFGLAAEMARSEGILVETVVVADDVALAHVEGSAGRRGIAGTILVHKIAGAAAADGKDLPQVAAGAQAAAENIGTMGVSLSAGVSPVTGKASFTLGDEVELGLGIHGEPGVKRVPIAPADELVAQLLNGIMPTLGIRSGDRVALLLNNLGSTTNMELAIVGKRALSLLEGRGVQVERILSGTFVSSLDMAGVSLSLMRVDDDRLKLLDAPTSAPAWPRIFAVKSESVSARTVPFAYAEPEPVAHETETAGGKQMERAVEAACQAAIRSESELTELDQLVGDGDLGMNMARAAKAVLHSLSSIPFDDPAEALKALGLEIQKVLGGSTGPLYGAFLLRAGNALSGNVPAAPSWAAALAEGCEAVSELGGASVGDRTMLDALVPFAHAFGREISQGMPIPEALRFAVDAASTGAERTAAMTARRGRSSYLGERALGKVDPGAAAVVILLQAMAREITGAA